MRAEVAIRQGTLGGVRARVADYAELTKPRIAVLVLLTTLAGYALAWESPAQGDEQLYRAKSALALGEKELELFRAVELKGDLVAALTLKEQHLEQALGYLIDTAGLPYAETLTAALFYAGEAFEQMRTATARLRVRKCAPPEATCVITRLNPRAKLDQSWAMNRMTNSC